MIININESTGEYNLSGKISDPELSSSGKSLVIVRENLSGTYRGQEVRGSITLYLPLRKGKKERKVVKFEEFFGLD